MKKQSTIPKLKPVAVSAFRDLLDMRILPDNLVVRPVYSMTIIPGLVFQLAFHSGPAICRLVGRFQPDWVIAQDIYGWDPEASGKVTTGEGIPQSPMEPWILGQIPQPVEFPPELSVWWDSEPIPFRALAPNRLTAQSIHFKSRSLAVPSLLLGHIDVK
ncbi:hypothetical protein CIHG_05978 [Coccidioides immitis H538.4]|uniref:Uncharacterized protein n=1 Tax=Coccidioides immitis H538.4 TaxID=396776 RepID=A0A0J8RR19_COCIT|nr:hypothetical protein CIHG_05978 [Coccidioides immitis H538.4]